MDQKQLETAYEKAFKSMQDWAGAMHDQLLVDGIDNDMAAKIIMGAFMAGVANITAQMNYEADVIVEGMAFAIQEGKKKVKPRFHRMQ